MIINSVRTLNLSDVVITTVNQKSLSVKWNHGGTKTLSDTTFIVYKVPAEGNDAKLFVRICG